MTNRILFLSFVLLMSIFQTSCYGDSQSDAWRKLSRMKAKDYFTDPVQVKLAEMVARGDADRIREVIDQGADVNAEGRDGMRPLFWAMGKNSLNGFEILLENGANPNVTASGRINGEGPPSVMELAAIAENPEYLRLALKHSGDPNFKVNYGDRTIIFEAILNNRTENVDTLSKGGADLSHQDTAGQTAIVTAAAISNYDMVYLLLERGADPTIKDRWGYGLVEIMNKFGTRGIKPESDQFQWYLKVVEEMKRRGELTDL